MGPADVIVPLNASKPPGAAWRPGRSETLKEWTERTDHPETARPPLLPPPGTPTSPRSHGPRKPPPPRRRGLPLAAATVLVPAQHGEGDALHRLHRPRRRRVHPGGRRRQRRFGDLGVGDGKTSVGGVARIRFGAAELSVAGLESASAVAARRPVSSASMGTPSQRERRSTPTSICRWRERCSPGPGPDRRGIDLGIGVGATLLDLQFDLQQPGTANRITTEQVIPVPMIGRAPVGVGPSPACAPTWAASSSSSTATKTTVIDSELSAAVEFLKVGELVVGYRVTSIDAQYDDSGAKVSADFLRPGGLLPGPRVRLRGVQPPANGRCPCAGRRSSHEERAEGGRGGAPHPPPLESP